MCGNDHVGPVSHRFGETVAWFLFCAASLQLAFLQPYFTIIPDERANIFSGILCAGSLLAAILYGCKDNARIRSLEGIVSIILSVLMILSSAFSSTPNTSFARCFVILAAGLGGFWCARILLNTTVRQAAFQWLCVLALAGIILLSFVSLITAGNFYSLVDSHWHPMVSRLLLFSFAPLALLANPSRKIRYLGIAVLVLSYVSLLMGGETTRLESAIAIPIIMVLLAILLVKWKNRWLVPMLAVIFVMSVLGGFHFARNPKDIRKQHISVAYRIENLFFFLENCRKASCSGNRDFGSAGRDAQRLQHQVSVFVPRGFYYVDAGIEDLRGNDLDLPGGSRLSVHHHLYIINIDPIAVSLQDGFSAAAQRPFQRHRYSFYHLRESCFTALFWTTCSIRRLVGSFIFSWD